MTAPLTPRRFLGADYDANTATYRYRDGSGVAYPEEMRQEVFTALSDPAGGGYAALLVRWRWEERLRGVE